MSANPGLCSSNLGRDLKISTLLNFKSIPFILSVVVMRSADRGASLILSGAFAEESCEVSQIEEKIGNTVCTVLYSWLTPSTGTERSPATHHQCSWLP